MKNNQVIIQAVEEFVKKKLQTDNTGHDWFHVHRVRSTALHIAKIEGGNLLVIELSALLHDVIDEKIVTSESEAIKEVQQWLLNQNIAEQEILHILEIIQNLSFKGGNRPPMSTLEGKIVQDADRLDALGAIGIARTFTYSGAKGQAMYDPSIEAREKMTHEEYRSGKSTAINHFYEKLLKLKELMNTDYGIRLAEERHQFMELFLHQFIEEWHGNK
jgi:uncharacterized protein